MDRIVECVPNFSEGRNEYVVRALVAVVRSMPDVLMLDHTMDPDHHRAVLTFAGTPEAVAEAAFRVTRAAAGLIDLRTHQGVHPRVGATDVVPFIPIRGATMEDCVALAKQVGLRIGNELDIPVFLYECATAHPDHANLESVRRGGLQGLAYRLESDPDWTPDFGPSRLHPTAGATVVGARPPLIAYNVNLQTRDVAVAKAIAKKVRTSSGGLPWLKAIGVELASRGYVQVAMNLTNYEGTSLHSVFDAVKTEAERRGVKVAGSEVVGLVPQRALVQAAEHHLMLERLDATQILETRLEVAMAHDTRARHEAAVSTTVEGLASSVKGFLSAVSAGTPSPGGGSVAALAGALAAALGLMTCRIGPHHAAERRLEELSGRLSELIQADAEAYAEVMQATRLPKTSRDRPVAVSTSLFAAAAAPLEVAHLSGEAARLLHALIRQVKPAVVPDLKVGVLMALAAMESSVLNAMENLKLQSNQHLKESLTCRMIEMERSLVELKSLCYTPPSVQE
ncbi:MAG: glutamate formimidoyltransferase [Nitrospiraceae bacterium]